jgi:predicted RNase H-like HicB family nuclease
MEVLFVRTVELKLPVSVHAERNQYVAICHDFHVASQGYSVDEALTNVKEALELFLEDEDVQEQFADKISKYIVRECKPHTKLANIQREYADTIKDTVQGLNRVVDIFINGESRLTGAVRA